MRLIRGTRFTPLDRPESSQITLVTQSSEPLHHLYHPKRPNDSNRPHLLNRNRFTQREVVKTRRAGTPTNTKYTAPPARTEAARDKYAMLCAVCVYVCVVCVLSLCVCVFMCVLCVCLCVRVCHIR